MKIVAFRTRDGLLRKLIAVFIAVLFVSWSVPYRVQAAAGDLDLTFGNGGKTTTDFAGFFDGASSVVIQKDGKIVVGGGASIRHQDIGDFALVRYNPDGSLDTSFGSNGKVTTAFANHAGIAAIAIQSDGKIVAGGSTYTNTFVDYVLARYNRDGSLDGSFGNGGTIITDFFGDFDAVNDLVIQADGKIVALGTTSKRDSFLNLLDTYFISRYNTDGSVDTAFGLGGKVFGNFENREAASDIEIGPDGKLVIAGGTLTASGSAYLIARYNTDGSSDSSFASNGRAEGQTIFGVACLAIQADGRMIVAGPFPNPATHYYDFTLVRHHTDGSVDTTFGSGGISTTDFGGSAQVHDLAIQADGKIVAVGEVIVDPRDNLDMCLSRYHKDGSPDLGFGPGGKTTTEFSGSFDVANDVAIQGDGKIVVAGYTRPSLFEDNDFAIARYEGIGYNICLQDDSTGNLLQLNTSTGDYQFTICSGLTIAGTGTLTKKGSLITLQHFAADRRVSAKIDSSTQKATASIQLLSQGRTYTVTDRNIGNNTCGCP